MKRIVFATFFSFFLLFASFFPAKSAETEPLFSFRGVLRGILEDAKEGTENIASEIESPFSGSRPATSSPEEQAPDENNFSFAILGDTQSFSAATPRGNFQKAVSSIAKQNPDLIISVGDLVSSCDKENECLKKYSDWKKILGGLMSKTYAVQGNHDRTGEDKADEAWRASFDFPSNGPSGYSEQVYSLDFKNSHFVFLGSDKPEENSVNEEQRVWLEKDLSASGKENKFVFFHEPAYPVSSKIAESLDTDPKERNALWEILEKHGVTAVFNGHEHIVSRKKAGSVYQFVFGSTDSFNHNLPRAGVAEYSNRGQGRFGIVRVNGKEITVEVHDPGNKVLNSFTFSK